MARKESITKGMLMDAAFTLLTEEGEENLTVRKIAACANCSTQPIFRIFKGMDELSEEVFKMVAANYSEEAASAKEYSKLPFVNLGMAYISYAKLNPNLFKFLFLPGKKAPMSFYDILNGTDGKVTAQVRAAQAAGVRDPGGLFSKFWIFIHGAACMSITGDYDLSLEETAVMLESTYKALLGAE